MKELRLYSFDLFMNTSAPVQKTSRHTLLIDVIGVTLGFICALALPFYFAPEELSISTEIEQLRGGVTDQSSVPMMVADPLIHEQNAGARIVERASSTTAMRLLIPKIHVNALVEYVGVTPDLVMDVPKGPSNVAWFKFGARPGEKGSAVIAGHEGWKDGIPAVFDELDKLAKGDKFSVIDENGATTTFVVRMIRVYGARDDASEVFGSHDGVAHLNLITCEGVWNRFKKSYASRLVIFSDKVAPS